MPQSKKRKTHKHSHQDFIPHQKERKSAVKLAIIVCVVLALGIAYFATEGNIIALIIGAISGVVIGYFGGKQMDKSFEK